MIESIASEIYFEMERVDEVYEAKMAAFEADCNEGKGEPSACHNVADFYAVVKNNHEIAFKLYSKNCLENSHPVSCFNLAKHYR